MRRNVSIAMVIGVALLAIALSSPVQATCEGTSGGATIGGAQWTPQCVFAATSPDCVDSTGASYECFQIIGTDSTGTYVAVSIFLDQEPTQGQTYDLGGNSGNGALILGQAGFWITANDPYVGQVQVTVYDAGSGTIECSFSFLAQPLLFGSDLLVENGTFSGKLLAVTAKSWAEVKGLYRER